jgi:molybdate transport system regulatory protein
MAKNPEVSGTTGQHVRRNMSALQIRTKVWLECDGAFVFGDGGLELLDHIQRLRSLTKAAAAIGWSYRHAWGYLRNAERRLGAPLVTTSPGKGVSRGTTLTSAGSRILSRLRTARHAATVNATKMWRRS